MCKQQMSGIACLEIFKHFKERFKQGLNMLAISYQAPRIRSRNV
ncbi:hypothetical protein VIBNISFn118_150031 [Vibrio nigripulchritudo SFn118]|nr:hypothetical protein VIBNISFn118_150031 [Vibrio nigripulchritudo SFn118]